MLGLVTLLGAIGCSAGAPVASTITLDGRGQPIGSIGAMVRCGDLLLFADSVGQVRRFDLATGKTVSSIARDVSNESMAADCGGRTLYLLGDSASRASRSRRGLHAINIDTGVDRLIAEPDLMMVPNRTATIDGDAMVVGGTWMPLPAPGYRHPPSDRFYSDKKLGVRIAMASGEVQPLFEPFDATCRAMCGYSSLSPVAGRADIRWIATQASTHAIALLDGGGRLVKRIDVSSSLFKDDGTTTDGGSEASMRWAARNSAVRSADQFGDVIAIVQYRLRMPPDWVFGQSLEADYWMNVYDFAGRLRAADIKLPGMPVGRDVDHMYCVEYGADGRNSAPSTIAVHRVAMPR